MSTPTLSPGTPLLAAASLIALLAGCATTPPSTPAIGDHPAASSAMSAPSGKEATLQKGMTAEAARAIMGEPTEIRPMKSPAGQAEIWVYRRKTQGAVQQVMVGMKSTPITTVNNNTGQAIVLQTIDEPILRQQAEIIEETVNLLIFDGKYIEQSRTVQRHLVFQ